MKKNFSHIIQNRWWQEAAILLFALSIFWIKNDWVRNDSMRTIGAALAWFAVLYVHAQVNRFFALPILMKDHKPWRYVGLALLLLFAFSGFLHLLSTACIYTNSNLYKASHQKAYLYQLASLVGTMVLILGPTAFLKIYRDQKKKDDEALLLNNMQLNSLKSQLNPHFLFNTFNTLYGISLKYPERTPDLIMKVAQLMRYQLETDTKQCVTLEDELNFIESYIQLETERVGYRCEITYDNNIDKKDAYKISPMLLINFVENAFKHGTCAIENCFVHIFIFVKEGKLRLKIVNSIPEKKAAVVSTKIGLKNTTERLNLLFGDDYMLDLQEDGQTYTVQLQIPLRNVN